MNKLVMLLFMLVLLAVPVLSIEYNDASINSNLVNFEFCFNPDLEKEFYKTNFMPYVDVVSGCEILEQKVVAKLPVKLTSTTYYDVTTCLWKDDKTQEKVNGTYPQIQECTVSEKSKTSSEDIIEEFDLQETDILFSKDMELCVRAKRRASTNNQSCDVNLNIDMNNDGDFTDVNDVRIVDDGFAWWNSTWQIKYLINVSTSTPFTNPYKLIINSSYVTMSDCQSDGGDVRFTNVHENVSLVYNISSWNASEGVVFINESSLAASNIYLYCNASTPQTSTSVSLVDSTHAMLHYAGNGNYEDSGLLANKTLSNVGTGQSFDTTTQKLGSGAMEFTNDGAAAFANPEGLATGNVNHTYSFWQNLDVIDVDYHIGIGNIGDSTQNSALQYQVTAVDFIVDGLNTVSATPPNLNVWEYATFVYWANETLDYYLNGSFVNSIGGSISTFNLQFGEAYSFCLNSRSGDCLAAVFGDGSYDDVRYYEHSLTPDQISALYDGGVGTESNLVFYGSPAYTVGSATTGLATTSLTTGFFNESYTNVSSVLEGEEFIIWANYSYDDNSSSVYPLAWCNYTAYEVISEEYFSTAGTNLTVCDGACDSTNYTKSFTNLPYDEYDYDIFRFKVCKNEANPVKNVVVSTNCSYNFIIPYDTIPLCAAGYLDLELNSSACGGGDVNLSIWSSATSSSKALVLVDSFIGVDRVHNDTAINMTWNATLDLFVNTAHEYYESGTYGVSVDCYVNISGIENQTVGSSDLLVGNVPPSLLISGISWWLTPPVQFTPSIQAKYPLSNFINISGVCADTDLSGFSFNLSYDNASLIYSSFTPDGSGFIPFNISLDQTNFSVETNYLSGVLEYTACFMCNDTNGGVVSECRDFGVVNLPPAISWVNVSPVLTSVVPVVLNWSCVDPEEEVGNAFLFIDNTNLSSPNGTTTDSGHIFNLSEGTYNLSVFCEDSFRNSTQADLLITYSSVCDINLVGLSNGFRYRDNTVVVSVNCSNGINLTACSYSINGFASESFVCGGDNATLEIGRNLVNVSVVGNGLLVSESYQVFAKKMSTTVSDYIILFVLIGLVVLLVWFANQKYDAGLSHILVVASIGLLGYYLIALNLWVGVFVWIIGLFYVVYNIFK